MEKYYIVDSTILPDVLDKVIEARVPILSPNQPQKIQPKVNVNVAAQLACKAIFRSI